MTSDSTSFLTRLSIQEISSPRRRHLLGRTLPACLGQPGKSNAEKRKRTHGSEEDPLALLPRDLLPSFCAKVYVISHLLIGPLFRHTRGTPT